MGKAESTKRNRFSIFLVLSAFSIFCLPLSRRTVYNIVSSNEELTKYLMKSFEIGFLCFTCSYKLLLQLACEIRGYPCKYKLSICLSLSEKDVEKPVVNLDCNVCQDYKNMLDTWEDTDVTIQIEDQSFKAHRSILAARSPVFAAMLRHHMKEKTTGVVKVTDCDASSFPVFLEFLYCGSIEKLSVENVFSLYNTADKYDRQDLKLSCLQFMKINLSVEFFCETVHLSLQHSETELFNLAIDFFAKNMKKIIKTSKWEAFILENPIQGNNILIKALEW